MKKLIFLVMAALVLMPTIVFAVAGTSTTPAVAYNADQLTNYKSKVISFTITDKAAGTTVAIAETDVLGYWLCSMETNPGATAPTDDYDIVINSAGGADLLGGAGANRDQANTEIAYPTIDSTSGQKGCVPVNGALSLVLSGNNVANATVEVKLLLVRP